MFQFAFPAPCSYIRTSSPSKPSISAVAASGGGGGFDGFVGVREISEAVGLGIKFVDWRWKSESEGYEGWSWESDMIVVCFHLRCWETWRRGNMACQAAREIQTSLRLQAMGMANCRCLKSRNQIFYNISFLYSVRVVQNELSFPLFNAFYFLALKFFAHSSRLRMFERKKAGVNVCP